MKNPENLIVNVTDSGKLKKVRRIKISLVLPESFKSEIHDIESVYLSIRDEENKPIAGWKKSVMVQDENDNYLSVEIHQIRLVDLFKNPQEVDFDFTTHGKLLGGSYSAKIYLVEKYLTSIKFRVRKWYEFF